jgi:hypothetical protein
MKITMMAIDAVKPYEKNPRINDHAVAAVALSIQTFGFRQPLVVDKANVLIIGHTRLKAAKSLGMTEVPVHVATDLTAEQTRALRLADNKTGEIADWDDQALLAELRSIKNLPRSRHQRRGRLLPGLVQERAGSHRAQGGHLLLARAQASRGDPSHLEGARHPRPPADHLGKTIARVRAGLLALPARTLHDGMASQEHPGARRRPERMLGLADRIRPASREREEGEDHRGRDGRLGD